MILESLIIGKLILLGHAAGPVAAACSGPASCGASVATAGAGVVGIGATGYGLYKTIKQDSKNQGFSCRSCGYGSYRVTKKGNKRCRSCDCKQ